MRVVVTPDKFKSSLTAVGAAEAIGKRLRQGRPGVDLERCQRDASTLVSLARPRPQTSPQFRAAAEAEGSGDQPAAPADSTQSR
jgi:hypothetical protein